MAQAIKIVRFFIDGKLYDVDPTTFAKTDGGTQYTSINSHRPNAAVQAETIPGTCSVDIIYTPDVKKSDIVGTGRELVAEYDNGITFKMAGASNSTTPEDDTDGGKFKVEFTGNPWEQTAP
jgi:hypothetical protein